VPVSYSVSPQFDAKRLCAEAIKWSPDAPGLAASHAAQQATTTVPKS
jgi:hypothetical protein